MLASQSGAPLLVLFAREDVPQPRHAIVSGLRVEEAIAPEGFCERRRVERDGWIAQLLERGG
jgi:hypothetical protein